MRISQESTIPINAASNARAKRFIAGLKKTKDIKVNVTGTVKDERIAVSKIALL